MILSRLRSRRLQPELMDQPGLPQAEHDRALSALSRVNALSLVAGRIWSAVGEMEARSPGKPVRVLDIACGGGDVAVDLARRASASPRVTIHGCDVSPVALDHARRRAARAGVQVDFFHADLIRDGIPAGYDLVACSLFLHHLSEPEAVRLLVSAREAAPVLVLQDLRRGRMGFLLAWGVLRLISRSRIAHVDGPRSVEGAFSIPEVAALAEQAGLTGADIRSCWPERFILTYRRPA